MEAFDGCQLRSSSSFDDAKCEAAAISFARQATSIVRYWATRVELSGGTESTKNKEEQTNLAEAGWVLEGVHQGLVKLYPERFDSAGNLQQKCEKDGATIWGAENCESVIADWVNANNTPTAPCLGDAC